jgi:hypothetical protein
MWQNSIIKELSRQLAEAPPSLMRVKMEIVLDTIRVAPAFFLDAEHAEIYAKLPYHDMVLLYSCPVTRDDTYMGESENAIIICKEEEGYCGYNVMRYAGIWVLSVYQLHLPLDGSIGSVSSLIDIKDPQFLTEINRDATIDVCMLRRFQLMLACKNISTVTVNPNRRKTNGKLRRKDLYTYKVLRIIPGKSSKGTQSTNQEKHTRVHFCRGHFKHYTETAPLFGKFVGLYWWEPHMRGDEEGFIEKDYKL